MTKAFAVRCMAAAFLLQTLPAGAAPGVVRVPLIATDASGTSTFGLPNGSRISIAADGSGERMDAAATHSRPVMIVRPNMRTAFERSPGPSTLAIAERIASSRAGTYASGEVVVAFRGGVNVAALQSTLAAHRRLSTVSIGDAQLTTTLEKLRPISARPLFAKAPATMPAIAQTYVIRIGAGSPVEAARRLKGLQSVAYASPNYYVNSFATDPVPMPAWEQNRASRLQASLRMHRSLAQTAGPQVTLPSNYGLTSSLQSYLNANSIDVVGAYAQLMARFGQIPGQGERITNVSLGDLTDQSMADNGDTYVQYYGPTTIVQGGQRYLDIPSMPLIPTYTADINANLNPTGSVEGIDPFLGEVLLDFSVMAPLPHDLQRGNAIGSGDTDLLGIAPGAQYRLVVPEQPTYSNIDAALIAAATQIPRPDVITASLGYGTDGVGFPGRYLEDDPLTEAIVSAIVKAYGIVVCISSDDGTRLYTNEPVGPDGGSTPTDVIADGGFPTSIGDDADSTTPTKVFDSGAIAAGGSTLDDIFVAPPGGNAGFLNGQGAFAETRLDGGLNFSSGFGTRVNASAPSDNIPSMIHECTSSPCTAQSVVSVLEGGTSASSPEIAAAAADVLQAARLAGKRFMPADVRAVLAVSGRELPDAPQIDRHLNVGPQIDVSNAVSAVLGRSIGRASVARVGVALRQNIGNIGGSFVEATDPSNIDLSGPIVGGFLPVASGQNAVSPITIAPDWLNVPNNVRYELSVNGKTLAVTPSARLLPERILAAAGLPLASTSARTVTLTYNALRGKEVVAGTTIPMTFAPTDGTYIEALAPLVPAKVDVGQPVTVSYDLTHVRAQSNGVTNLQNPQLIVSSIGHWNPINAPYFRIAYSVPLTALKGNVTIPASVFAAGGGIYGVGILQNPQIRLVGEFAPIRVHGQSQRRPEAPTLSFGPFDIQQSHMLTVTRAQPQFSVHYDVSNVPRATGAILEISAPGPTLGNLLNVFTNAFGTMRDNNGTDSGSTVYQQLPGTVGSVALDAKKLQLPSSLQYTVRVLPSNGLSVVGEASPVSSLAYEDGITPGGAYVSSFDISPQGTSTVGTIALGANGQVVESGIFPYQPSNGTYQTPFVDDATGQSQYFVFGSDPQLNQTAAVDFGQAPPSNQVTTPPQNVEAFNDATGALVSSASIDPSLNETITGAMVDRGHHRLAMLTYNFYNGDAQVFPYALQPGTLGSPILVASRTQGRLPTTLDIDQSTGQLFMAPIGAGDNCVIFRAEVFTLDIDTAKVSNSGRVPGCIANIASDDAGGSAYLANGSLETIGGLPGFQSRLIPVAEGSLQVGTAQTLPDRGAYLSGVDPVHHVLLEGFVASNDLYVNNNAMSAVDVIDLRTGAAIAHMPTFGFLYPLATNIPFIQRGIQVDPSTRTAWTYGAGGDTIQQFSY